MIIDRSKLGSAARHRRRPRALPAGPHHGQRRDARRRRARLGRDPEPEGPRALGDRSRARRRRVHRRVRAVARRQDPRAARALRGDGRRRVRAARRAGAPGLGRPGDGVDRADRRRRSTRTRSPRPTSDVERLRIHAGFLRYGVDVDEDHFPFETPLVAVPRLRARAATSARSRCSASTRRATRRACCAASSIEGAAPVAPGTAIKHAAKDNAGDGDLVDRRRRPHDSRSATCTAPRWEPGGTVEIDGRGARRCTSCRGRRVASLARSLLALLAGCSYHHRQLRRPTTFSGDPFPIDGRDHERRDRARHARRPAPTIRIAVLDLLSPFTVIDHGPDVDAADRRPATSTLLGERRAGGAARPAARAARRRAA